jgi:hypothetical protein
VQLQQLVQHVRNARASALGAHEALHGAAQLASECQPVRGVRGELRTVQLLAAVRLGELLLLVLARLRP